MTATFYVGDAVTVMNTLPEKSVDLVISSPPFLALRSYLPPDHPDKALEGGSQATPGEFIDWLLDVVEACARVLAPHGSLCFELGDTYSGMGGAGGDWSDSPLTTKARVAGGSDGGPTKRTLSDAWPLAKSLSLIPETFRWAMVYGHNPHTGRTTPPWRLRNVIRWVRPNPPVGALGDKFRPATSELMVFCKAKDRFFDLDAVREPYSDVTVRQSQKPSVRGGRDNGPKSIEADTATVNRRNQWSLTHSGAPPLDWWNIPLLDGDEPTKGGPKERPLNRPAQGGPKETQARQDGVVRGAMVERTYHKDGGAPPLDWWNIPPGGYPGAHYAVWPPELLVKPIKAMCPEKVCRVCGEASRRIVGEATYAPSESHGGTAFTLDMRANNRKAPGVNQWTSPGNQSVTRHADTLGFSDCGHDDYRPGLVLDPFAGSGTTLSVATGHGRDAIGIDLDERNYELALDRVGPLILERGTEPARRINS